MYRQLAQLPRGANACATSEGTERSGARAVVYRAVGGFICAFESVRRSCRHGVLSSRVGNADGVVSRRSDALKAFAGDTALPGGKVDAEDVTIEDTAVRRPSVFFRGRLC